MFAETGPALFAKNRQVIPGTMSIGYEKKRESQWCLALPSRAVVVDIRLPSMMPEPAEKIKPFPLASGPGQAGTGPCGNRPVTKV
jgi:hypothetical protein